MNSPYSPCNDRSSSVSARFVSGFLLEDVGEKCKSKRDDPSDPGNTKQHLRPTKLRTASRNMCSVFIFSSLVK